jgi:uncharacterized protein DUF4115
VLLVEILAAVVVAALAAGIFTRRRSHDDAHSVEGYHRQLHTLEHISVHPVDAVPVPEMAPEAKPAYPESAVRVAGSPHVRLTEPRQSIVPPVPPPVVPNPDVPVTFDDAAPLAVPLAHGSARRQDRAMSAMNRRPRRLAAPVMAVVAVTVLIVVLLLAGAHKVPPVHHSASSAVQRTKHSKDPKVTKRVHHSTTPTTAAPVVSLPAATSFHAATYRVAAQNYSMELSATTGPCWVDVMDTASHSTLFAGVLSPGEEHTVTATGSVEVEVGAPTQFAASIDDAAVVLPYGFQTPFTLVFIPLTGATTATST